MESPTAVGRKRARPVASPTDAQLREQVLALIRKTRAPLVAQRRSLELAYDAAWRAFCRALASDHASEPLAAALHALAREAHGVDTASELLAAKVASCVAAARGRARQQRLVLVWTWLGHASRARLWRLGDVLLAVQASADPRSGDGDGSRAGTWLRGAMQSLVADGPEVESEERLLRKFSVCDPSESRSSSIIKYLVRIAFSRPESEASRTSALGDIVSLAYDALDAICRWGPADSAGRPLALVCRVVADSIQQHQNATDAVAVVASLRAFLRAQARSALMALVCSREPPQVAEETVVDEILATLQCAVSPADVVQLFRQAWVDAKTVTPDARDPIELLAPRISCCAQREAAFRSHALATAHDLALDAIMASDAVLLRHSLELAGAATVGSLGQDGDPEDAGYADWFRNHFAAVDTHSTLSGSSSVLDSTRQSLPGVEATTPPVCLRAPSPTPSSGGSSNSFSSACCLVSTKRHLQFMCAFLAEFDRAESPRQRAYHVLAHLSAIKTHQTISGSAVGGLLADFFSQTRARYGELNAREQELSARLRRRRLSSLSSVKTSSSVLATPSQATPASSQYAPTTRGIVEELLELHNKDPAALASRVNQIKMFQAYDWKHKILPCSLDIEYWQNLGVESQDATDDGDNHQLRIQRRKRISAIVRLVQVMAKHHAVGTPDYVAFLERVEAWFISFQHQNVNGVRRHSSHSSAEQNLTRLEDAVKEYFDGYSGMPEAERLASSSSWGSVASEFVVAFEALIIERPLEQVDQMERIHETTVFRLTHEGAVRSFTVSGAVDHYLALWIALLSNETVNDATPQERMDVMEAYCKLSSQRAVRESTTDSRPLALDERLVEIALHGALLGLLASVTICETMARAASLAFCEQLEPATPEPTVDDLIRHLQRASAFLSGFLIGFTKNSSDNAPQILLQSMLTPQMRACLIWVGQHTTTWWNSDVALRAPPDDAAREDPFWPFVQRTFQSAHDQHGWFRLTFSPGVFTTKDQWQVFVAMELTCCVTQLLDGATQRRVDVVDFVSRQHEQMHGLMLSSTGGQSAGVRVIDVCMWIVQATLELSASSPRVAPFALDALVLLLKDMWAARERGEASSGMSSPSDMLGFLLELTLQLLERSHKQRNLLVHYAVRCASIMVEEKSAGPLLVNVPATVVRNFVDQVCLGVEGTVVPFEWVRVTWCIVLKLQYETEVYSSAIDIPASIFAHWAFEFPRLCRFLTVRKNGKVNHATNAALLRTVQMGYEFFRTLNLRRLAPAPSVSLVGVSASQYVPSSVAGETLELHVRALEWLIASDRLSVPSVGGDLADVSSVGFETSLAFHEVAGRVLRALLEDLSIGRPDEVATELTEICQASWVTSVSTGSTSSTASPPRFQFQLLLVHMVADLVARHASVGRFLLRSSSELLSDARRSLFLLLVLIASKELEQIESVLKLNGSLWINTFAEVACSLQAIHEPSSDDSGTPTMVSLMRHSTGFGSQLVAVLSRMLSFAAAKQIDLLDAAVIARMEQLFPSLSDVLARVPVLNLASAALGDW